MAVYVDDYRARYRRMVMVHMVADSDDELHAMAEKIGVARRWHQAPPAHASHYDICGTKKAQAIKLGAIAITSRQCAAMTARRRHTGELGKPEEAIEWYRSTLPPLRTAQIRPDNPSV